eukprot:TRINITY_DN1586_c0_g3_i1.p1 TRINITY_DN1586_c0_g3~~TRINITY_DN1586_c0_g3_i1.p1  ORF type:complete len:111 (+),score=35.08 TRINITY_DN1586_c0_g3_i1:154-486(+)
MSDTIEEFAQEQTKFSQHLRNVTRQLQQQQLYLQKRKADNMQRRANGEPEIDEDLAKNPLFKPVPAPSRLERFLLGQQMSHFCDTISSSSNSAMPKLFVMDALAGSNKSE